MHEMSLAEGVLELVEAAARREAATRVRLVVVEIGCLAAVEPEALRFCFDAVTRGTVAAGALLEIAEVPGSGWCAQCAATVPLAERYSACPQCGGYPLEVTGGTEMRVREIAIE
jgi:hydrogenase nickel incorporation protein HypA/HybF